MFSRRKPRFADYGADFTKVDQSAGRYQALRFLNRVLPDLDGQGDPYRRGSIILGFALAPAYRDLGRGRRQYLEREMGAVR